MLGFAADLDAGVLLFGLNGRWELPMGAPWPEVEVPEGGLTPALSADQGFTARLNLGEQLDIRPWRFGPPDPTFRAVASAVVEQIEAGA